MRSMIDRSARTGTLARDLVLQMDVSRRTGASVSTQLSRLLIATRPECLDVCVEWRDGRRGDGLTGRVNLWGRAAADLWVDTARLTPGETVAFGALVRASRSAFAHSSSVGAPPNVCTSAWAFVRTNELRARMSGCVRLTEALVAGVLLSACDLDAVHTDSRVMHGTLFKRELYCVAESACASAVGRVIDLYERGSAARARLGGLLAALSCPLPVPRMPVDVFARTRAAYALGALRVQEHVDAEPWCHDVNALTDTGYVFVAAHNVARRCRVCFAAARAAAAADDDGTRASPTPRPHPGEIDALTRALFVRATAWGFLGSLLCTAAVRA